eukprot:4767918-Prymnesium_polylepis.1
MVRDAVGAAVRRAKAKERAAAEGGERRPGGGRGERAGDDECGSCDEGDSDDGQVRAHLEQGCARTWPSS